MILMMVLWVQHEYDWYLLLNKPNVYPKEQKELPAVA